VRVAAPRLRLAARLDGPGGGFLTVLAPLGLDVCQTVAATGLRLSVTNGDWRDELLAIPGVTTPDVEGTGASLAVWRLRAGRVVERHSIGRITQADQPPDPRSSPPASRPDALGTRR